MWVKGWVLIISSEGECHLIAFCYFFFQIKCFFLNLLWSVFIKAFTLAVSFSNIFCELQDNRLRGNS